MNRRTLLKSIAALPILGPLAGSPELFAPVEVCPCREPAPEPDSFTIHIDRVVTDMRCEIDAEGYANFIFIDQDGREIRTQSQPVECCR